MTVYVLWNGGENYSPAERSGLESFPNLSSVRAEMRDRINGWGCFRYVSGERENVRTPDVSMSYAFVYLSDPREVEGWEWGADAYPDRMFSQGKRGGIVDVNV